MKNYRELNVWKSGHAVTLQVYRQIKSFPKEELFDLTSQMRRAASTMLAAEVLALRRQFGAFVQKLSG
jgi:four helix bundle protein